MTMSPKDKSRASHGFGYTFHHTDPQRRLPCILGDMLMPLSADDIAPITASALTSVEQALDLLAGFITDRDFQIYLSATYRAKEAKEEAAAIQRAKYALRAILRTQPACKACETRRSKGFDGQCPACARERVQAEMAAERALKEAEERHQKPITPASTPTPTSASGPWFYFLANTGEIFLTKPNHEDHLFEEERCYRLPASCLEGVRLALNDAMLVEGKGLEYRPSVLAWFEDRHLGNEEVSS